jgi:hypothetical protein
MVDYYPLLNRAIASLGASDATARATIYERARGALERQLRGFDPPIAEEDIRAQLDTLEAVITRIEAEQTQPPPSDLTPPAEAAPQPEPVVAAETPKPEAVADSPEPPPPAESRQPAEPVMPPPLPPAVPEALANEPVLPPVSEMPALPAAPEPGLRDLRDLRDADEPAGETAVPPSLEGTMRPRMPMRDTKTTSHRKPLFIFLGIGIVAMLGMGLLAMNRLGKPGRQDGPPVVTAPGETGTDPAKTEGRLASAENQPTTQVAPPASAPPAPPRPAQPAPPAAQPTTPPAAPPGNAGGVVTQSSIGRAFMVLEPTPGAPSQFEGRVNWSYQADNTLGGQKSLRALIEFPNAQLNVDFSISRNSDSGLGASHIIMVIFDGRNGLGNVLEMSAVEWRERENQVGGLLNGTVVPIQTNVFMIGLDKAEANVTRNLDLLQSQKWMVFEFRLQNGRRGAALVEKGLSGDKAIAEALRDWR